LVNFSLLNQLRSVNGMVWPGTGSLPGGTDQHRGHCTTLENNRVWEVREMTSHDIIYDSYIAGLQYENDGDLANARACYCLAVSARPDNPTYLRAAAKIAQRMGDIEDARILFREAIACARRCNPDPTAMFTSLVCEASEI